MLVIIFIAAILINMAVLVLLKLGEKKSGEAIKVLAIGGI